MSGPQFLFWLFAALACTGAVAVVISQNVVRMAVYLILSLGSAAGLFFLASADFLGATQLLVYVGGTLVLLIFGVMLTASGPYLRIGTSPAEGFLAGGIGLLFLTMIFATVLGVDWNRNALSLAGLAAVTPEQYDAAKGDHSLPEGTAKLLDETYSLDDSGSAPLYRVKKNVRLSRSEATLVAAAFGKESAVALAPLPKEGGTLRPLGMAFGGLRTDVKGTEGKLATGYLLPFEIASVHLLVVLIGAAYLARAKRRKPVEA